MVEGLACYWERICETLWELDENIVRTTRMQKSNTHHPTLNPPQNGGGKKKKKQN
jgi:hypothetical protein